MAGDRAELVAEVNRLYWETELPVTEMAERLGISRRTIYDMIVPLPVDEPCPECGGPLTYANRSARLSGEALCRACGRTQDLTLLHELSTAAHATAPVAQPSTAVARQPRLVPVRPAPQRPSTTLAALLVGALVLTVVAALLLPGPTRRRGFWR